jgi:hypothetical protein
MKQLDLKFVQEQYTDHLPSGLHQQNLMEVLATLLKKTKRLNNVLAHRGVLIPSGILDYANSKSRHNHAWPSVARPFVSGRQPSTHGNGLSQVEIEADRADCSIKLTMDQFSNWVEFLLAFHSFLKYGGHLLSDNNNIQTYHVQYCKLMSTLLAGFKRGVGTREFKLQKFVECAHFGKDHVIYGPPAAHNTDTGERGLKTWAKAPAKTAQKHGDKEFKAQVAKNITEGMTLERLVSAGSLYATVQQPPGDTAQFKSEGISASGRSLVYIHGPSELAGVFPATPPKPGQRDRQVHHQFPTEVKEYLYKIFGGSRGPSLTVQLFTEITLAAGTPQQELLRAHPDFRKGGPWYDFVEVDYGQDVGLYPARCA